MYTPKGELDDKLLKLMQTEEVVEKFAQAKSPDECYAIAKEAGVELSKEEFVANMEIMQAYLEENEEGVLSEDDLDQIAGGKSQQMKHAQISSGVIGGAGAVAVGAVIIGAASAAA